MNNILVIDNLNLLPHGYKQAVKTLIYKVNKTPKYAEKFRLLQAFSEKFTTLPSIWKPWYKMIHHSTALNFHYGKMKEKALKDFPMQEKTEWPSFTDYNSARRRLLNTEDYRNESKLYAFLPNSNITRAYDMYVALDDGTEDIAKKYETAYKIYQEMKEADIKDGKKYIEILKKTENEEFVIKNIECQLAKNPWCQSLWDAYIQYLNDEKKDKMAILSVLQRYCRFFINDKKIRHKYRTKIEEFSQSLDEVSEFWIDAIKFELQFLSVNTALALLNKALKAEMNEKMKFFNAALELAEQFRHPEMTKKIEETKMPYLTEHPEVDNYNFTRVTKNLILNGNTKMQKFTFSKPINRYLNDKLSHQHLQKLYQTCKWFYFKYRYNLVHRLEQKNQYSPGMYGQRYSMCYPLFEYIKSSIYLPALAGMESHVKNLWVINSVCIWTRNISILNVIKKATMKYLTLYYAHITEKEYELLTDSKTIVRLCYNSSRIFKTDATEYQLEDLLSKVPNVRSLDLSVDVTAETASKLQEIYFNNKFQHFNLIYRGSINAQDFFEFLLKNLSPSATLNLCCFNDLNFKNFITQKIATDWKPNERPIFTWKDTVFS